MIISDNIYSMLLTHEKFQSFLPPGRAIGDTKQATEVLIALNQESRAAVDDLVNSALAAGAKPFRDPADHGFMYERSFQDLDGHVWEHFWMDPTVLQAQS